MTIRLSMVLRELVVGMLRAMTMSFAEETMGDKEDEPWETLNNKVEGFINWLEKESPLS
jgi:hypothetical protein